MQVFIQQLASGLFLDAKARWVKSAEEAQAFEDSTAAINCSVERGIRDVRLVLRFGDPRYDVLLHPFGRDGKQPTEAELHGQRRELMGEHHELMEQGRALLADLDRIRAEGKERRKAYPFKPESVRKPATEDGDAASDRKVFRIKLSFGLTEKEQNEVILTMAELPRLGETFADEAGNTYLLTGMLSPADVSRYDLIFCVRAVPA
jgi:hypothetical protein